MFKALDNKSPSKLTILGIAHVLEFFFKFKTNSCTFISFTMKAEYVGYPFTSSQVIMISFPPSSSDSSKQMRKEVFYVLKPESRRLNSIGWQLVSLPDSSNVPEKRVEIFHSVLWVGPCVQGKCKFSLCQAEVKLECMLKADAAKNQTGIWTTLGAPGWWSQDTE